MLCGRNGNLPICFSMNGAVQQTFALRLRVMTSRRVCWRHMYAGCLAAVVACAVAIAPASTDATKAMAANRVKRVRCALCWNVATARLARQHNDANMISLGQRMLSEEEALEIVRVWLETDFEGGRHLRRIQLLDLE
jgi:ribose 5-phosphate isomerase RpiB